MGANYFCRPLQEIADLSQWAGKIMRGTNERVKMRRLSLMLALGAMQLFVGAYAGTEVSVLPGSAAADDSAEANPTFIFGQLKPAPAGAKLVTIPVLAPGQ